MIPEGEDIAEREEKDKPYDDSDQDPGCCFQQSHAIFSLFSFYSSGFKVSMSHTIELGYPCHTPKVVFGGLKVDGEKWRGVRDQG
jgi:hypothetical protein